MRVEFEILFFPQIFFSERRFMSTNESLTQSGEIPSEQAITIQPSGIAAYPASGDWMSAGGTDPSQEGAGGLAVLHAVRRHWLLALSTGLACAAVTGAVIYLLLPVRYKATAYLQLSPSTPTLLGNSTADQSQQVMNEFEIFRDTQASLIKTEKVITAALRDPGLKGLQCIAQADERHDAIQWLIDAIHVEFPGKNGGVMLVSATEPQDKIDSSLPPGKPAAAIVNAVVKAYMEQVVEADKAKRELRLNELNTIHADKGEEVRKKREQLKREQEAIGAADEQTMAARTQLAVSMYSEFQREFQRMKSEQRILVGKLQETERTLDEMQADQAGAEIPEVDVVMLLNPNPVYRDLQSRLAMLQGFARIHSNAIAPGTKLPAGFNRTQADYEGTKAQIDALQEQTRKMVHDSKLIALKQEKSHLKSELDIYAGQITAFEKEVEKKRDDADSAGRSSISAQMAKADVENIERILRNVAEEQEHLRVELKSASRVTPTLAELPEHAARDYRNMYTICGSLFAMFLPAVGIVVWDLRKQRVNSASDVSKRMRIPVIGAVPRIPATVMRRLGDTSKKSQVWKLRFTESVDGVAARLLRKAECDQTRVILITSAVSGEGKTTLATQLAMSLARAQRRTVLVDFDLRQPTLDGALGLPLGPGICEALRGEGDVTGMVQQTETEGLSVVTAGSWNRQVLSTLSNGVVGTVLEQLRMNFDFVIIDSSPLLPIVDTRLVCQHVDAVLLSVLRDVSQSSKVMAAQEMLDAFGVRSVEAVVTGGEEHSNVKNLISQAAMFDEPAMSAGNGAELAKDVHATEENRQ